METVADFIFLGSQIIVDGDCSHEIKRHSLLETKAMTNIDSILKNRDITLTTNISIIKHMFFPIVMYGYENWTIKKAEHHRIDAFEFWCWRRLLRVGGDWIGLPKWWNGKESIYQCGWHKRCRFNPWFGKMPWKRRCQPTPVFLLAKFHRQESLVVYSPWSHKKSNTIQHMWWTHVYVWLSSFAIHLKLSHNSANQLYPNTKIFFKVKKKAIH